jgi:Tol biopolymer transport system component
VRVATRTRVTGAVLAAAALAALPSLAAGGAGPRTELTSLDRGVQVDGGASTFWRSLSGSGDRALFTVDDDDLPGANGTRDVYVRDLERQKTILVSRATNGEPADDDCRDDPAISGNGRFVALTCDATNFPRGGDGIFVRDLKEGKTKLVSLDNEGTPADDSSIGLPTLSADGRFVAYEADDDGFPGSAGTNDVYVRDRKQDRTILATRASDGSPAGSSTTVLDPSISGNGRYVAFRSDTDNLPGADDTGDFYVRDLREGRTELVSRTPAGDPVGGGLGGAASLSSDGRYALFESFAASLGADPSGSIFVRDRKRDTTKLVSQAAGGAAASGTSQSISANGRYAVYESDDDDLPGADGITDVFRFDLKSKSTVLISRSNGGTPGADDSFYPSVSGGGGVVAFTSRADNLSGQDADVVSDSFVRGPLD